jgi:hypothetical protein
LLGCQVECRLMPCRQLAVECGKIPLFSIYLPDFSTL